MQEKLIVIEGLDGSGKATQAEKLTRSLRADKHRVEQISFPDYGSRSSELVKMYLSGDVGALDQVNAYAASIFYAADRYISYMRNWKKLYQTGYTIIADRYVTSNAVHQMGKLPRQQWDDYLDWLLDLEFSRMQLPSPDLVVYLDVSPQASRRLLDQRDGGQTERDIHERNLAYLLQCRQAALYAAERLDWVMVDCCGGDHVLPVEEIADQIQTIVKNTIY